MSTVHFTADELSNVLSVLCGPRASEAATREVAEVLAAVSAANAETFEAHYGEQTWGTSADDLVRGATFYADFGSACGTALLLESNCGGRLSDEVAARLGRLVVRPLLGAAVDRLASAKESIAYLQGELAAARAAALAPAPAKARPRARAK